ncbi:MAG: ATP-binding cassette domain-containing protein [Clostridiales bacterium]|nr:ATP-binding cassette domain-containing protein [Clostridiales bacterium]
MILKTRKLKKHYAQSEHVVKALDGVDIDIKKGEFVSIVGKSGSGKSTLLHMLGGLDNQTSGEVIIDNTPLSQMTSDEMTIYRRRNIGFVFQSYNLIIQSLSSVIDFHQKRTLIRVSVLKIRIT